MMTRHKLSPRAQFRLQEGQRVLESGSLSARFPKLKSLRAQLSYHPPDGSGRGAQIKYTVNLDHAKSVFRFDCLNKECVRGDFDLSEVLAQAVGARRTASIGEMRCQGWRNKDSIETVCCGNILRYKLSL